MKEHCGPVTVKDLITGKVKRVEPPMTEKELKAFTKSDTIHENSMVERIKHDPKLLAKFQENRTKYLDDYDVFMSQHRHLIPRNEDKTL